MALLDLTEPALPGEFLADLREAVAAATEPDRLQGRSPYHYTFWYDLSAPPGNAVEEMVARHLVDAVPADVRDGVVGVEWWLGRLSAPYATNFEFGVHRDFGEHPDTGERASPALSSVLYLTTVEDGPLVVFPGAPSVADDGQEHVFPRENLFAKFPGHLWHGVLSRTDVGDDAAGVRETRTRLSVLVNWWPFRPSTEATAPMKLVAADFDGSVYPELAR